MKKYFIVAIFLFFLVGIIPVQAGVLNLMNIETDYDNFRSYNLNSSAQFQYFVIKLNSETAYHLDAALYKIVSKTPNSCTGDPYVQMWLYDTILNTMTSGLNGYYLSSVTANATTSYNIDLDMVAGRNYLLYFGMATSSGCTSYPFNYSTQQFVQEDDDMYFNPNTLAWSGFSIYGTTTDPYNLPEINIPLIGNISWLFFMNQTQVEDLHDDYSFLSTKAPFGYFAKIYEILEATSTIATTTLIIFG